MSWDGRGDHRPSLDEELRTVLGGAEPDFDYAALVAGTRHRAGRIRRRRTLTQVVAAAVLVPSLVGTGFALNHRLSVDEAPAVSVASQTPAPEPEEQGMVPAAAPEQVTDPVVTGPAPADQGIQTAPPAQAEPPQVVEEPAQEDAPVDVAAPPAESDPADEPASAPAEEGAPEPDPALTPDPAPVQEPVAPTAPVALPPYQDPGVVLPDAPGGPSTDGSPNLIAVPDPRPTGVAALDAFGAPWSSELFQNITPLMGITFTQEPVGVDQHSARSWQYSTGGWESVVITLTAWDDSSQALADLTTGGTTLRSRWAGQLPEPMAWRGHEGDPDYFLTSTTSAFAEAPDTWVVGVAMVRQGDYLVAVAVDGQEPATARAQAAEIAEKSAANLAVLDPLHGGG